MNAQGWAERFEFYWQGLELANAFYEIDNPQEQKEVFEQDLLLRKQKKAEEAPEDQELLGEMKTMPEKLRHCFGV